jgi:hypothetical protein
MKIGRMTISAVSLLVLFVQLALVSTVTAKYLYERWRCPRVWTRAAAYDPELPLRGRYLSLQLTVDGCQSTLPSAKQAGFPRYYSGAVKPGPFYLRQPVNFQAKLQAVDGRLTAIRAEGVENPDEGEWISAAPNAPCDQMRLQQPVDFFIAEKAQSPLPLLPGQELWIEVTVPPKGPPRPIQLAVKADGAWRPLTFK